MPVLWIPEEEFLSKSDLRLQHQQCAMRIHDQRELFFLKSLLVRSFSSNDKRHIHDQPLASSLSVGD